MIAAGLRWMVIVTVMPSVESADVVPKTSAYAGMERRRVGVNGAG